MYDKRLLVIDKDIRSRLAKHYGVGEDSILIPLKKEEVAKKPWNTQEYTIIYFRHGKYIAMTCGIDLYLANRKSLWRNTRKCAVDTADEIYAVKKNKEIDKKRMERRALSKFSTDRRHYSPFKNLHEEAFRRLISPKLSTIIMTARLKITRLQMETAGRYEEILKDISLGKKMDEYRIKDSLEKHNEKLLKLLTFINYSVLNVQKDGPRESLSSRETSWDDIKHTIRKINVGLSRFEFGFTLKDIYTNPNR